MDLRLALDVVAIFSGVLSVGFWLSSRYVYRDIHSELKSIRQETFFTVDSKTVAILAKIEKQINRNVARINNSEARLNYLEGIFVKDESYCVFVEKLNEPENSDFT